MQVIARHEPGGRHMKPPNGTLAAGKVADFLVLDGNLEDINNTQRISRLS